MRVKNHSVASEHQASHQHYLLYLCNEIIFSISKSLVLYPPEKSVVRWEAVRVRGNMGPSKTAVPREAHTRVVDRRKASLKSPRRKSTRSNVQVRVRKEAKRGWHQEVKGYMKITSGALYEIKCLTSCQGLLCVQKFLQYWWRQQKLPFLEGLAHFLAEVTFYRRQLCFLATLEFDQVFISELLTLYREYIAKGPMNDKETFSFGGSK